MRGIETSLRKQTEKDRDTGGDRGFGVKRKRRQAGTDTETERGGVKKGDKVAQRETDRRCS